MTQDSPGSPAVVLYGTPYCPYCMAARRLLKLKGVAYSEHNVERDPDRRAEMEQRSGRRTVPQIFIGARHIGGFDELNALEQSGELDGVLQQGHRVRANDG